MFVSHSDLCAMTRNATGLHHLQGLHRLHPMRSDPRRRSGHYRVPHLLLPVPPVRPRAVYGIALEEKTKKKPAICTADELHYVPVPNSNWTLALWRYLPSPQVLPLALVFSDFIFLFLNCVPYTHVFNVFLWVCMYVYEIV